MTKIAGFFGEHRFLSNFWPATVVLDGVTYPSVENAYQASKTTLAEERKVFVACSAKEAKHFGRKVTLRPDFDLVKVEIMHDLVYQKFSMHRALRAMLLGTGDAYLEETNTWRDTFWGVCDGSGKNHLGHILMEVRKGLDDMSEGRVSLCIFGSRDFSDLSVMTNFIEHTTLFKGGIDEIICGMARGADITGKRFAEQYGIPVVEMPADWDRFGKSAGYRRNEEMAAVSTHAIGFWDGESRGTKHMIDICVNKGIPTLVINYITGKWELMKPEAPAPAVAEDVPF